MSENRLKRRTWRGGFNFLKGVENIVLLYCLLTKHRAPKLVCVPQVFCNTLVLLDYWLKDIVLHVLYCMFTKCRMYIENDGFLIVHACLIWLFV